MHKFNRVWLHFQSTTLRREKNLSVKLLNLPTAGIEPWPPAQQASTLSITPLPLVLADFNFHTATKFPSGPWVLLPKGHDGTKLAENSPGTKVYSEGS